MFVGKLRAPIKTSDVKKPSEFFRLVSYTHLGTIMAWYRNMQDKISTSNAATRRKPEIASMKYAHSLQADACVYRFDAFIFGLQESAQKR